MNHNLVIWTTDWHLVSNDGESAGTGQPTTPTKAQAIVAHLNGLDPLGCFDTGDNKDHYGAVGTEDEHDNYITYVGNQLRWLTLNAGDTNADFPNLPGNHDEFYDSGDTPPGGNNDFAATYDAKFWGPPYHWTCDWPSAQVRFITIHSYMHHINTEIPDGSVDAVGAAHVDIAEKTWLQNELASLPPGWVSFVLSHFPIANVIGNNIRYTGTAYDYETSPLNDVIAAAGSKVVACLSGHRHQNWNTTIQGGVLHITSGGVSYGVANGRGSYTRMTHDPVARSLTLDQRYATSPYERFAGFTPLVLAGIGESNGFIPTPRRRSNGVSW